MKRITFLKGALLLSALLAFNACSYEDLFEPEELLTDGPPVTRAPAELEIIPSGKGNIPSFVSQLDGIPVQIMLNEGANAKYLYLCHYKNGNVELATEEEGSNHYKRWFIEPKGTVFMGYMIKNEKSQKFLTRTLNRLSDGSYKLVMENLNTPGPLPHDPFPHQTWVFM